MLRKSFAIALMLSVMALLSVTSAWAGDQTSETQYELTALATAPVELVEVFEMIQPVKGTVSYNAPPSVSEGAIINVTARCNSPGTLTLINSAGGLSYL